MTGVICIDKCQGKTSFDVVAAVRRLTGERKAGHTGTLDPMATGVLPVMLGGATRFLDFLPDSDKRYRAVFELGRTTDTLDDTGTVLTTSKVECSKEDVLATASKFTGEITQIPPMYSAVSVNGRRLYELARKGETVERPERKATVYSLQVVSSDEVNNRYTIDVSCSKGTYIRTLIDDIGRELGCGAVMTALRRTCAMGLDEENSVTLERLGEICSEENGVNSILIPVEKLLEVYPFVRVTAAQGKRFSNGGELDGGRLPVNIQDGLYRVIDQDGRFLGLGRGDSGQNCLKVARILTVR